MSTQYIVFFVVIFATHLIQGITGFGSIVLALPILVYFFPLKTLIPPIILVNLFQCAWFGITQRHHIHWRHLWSIVALAMFGLPVGYGLYSYLPSDELKLALGFFVIFVAVYNLSGVKLKREAPPALYHSLNFFGGVTQGALAAGGPFVVIYAAKMLEDKGPFRATLSMVWIFLNVSLCVVYTVRGKWTGDMVPIFLYAVPAVAIGTALGMYLHDRIPIKPFRTMIFVILLLTGLLLLRPLLGYLF